MGLHVLSPHARVLHVQVSPSEEVINAERRLAVIEPRLRPGALPTATAATAGGCYRMLLILFPNFCR